MYISSNTDACQAKKCPLSDHHRKQGVSNITTEKQTSLGCLHSPGCCATISYNAELILGNIKPLTFSSIPQNCYGAVCRNPTPMMTRTCLFHTVNAMAVDNLETWGARASTAMVLILSSWNMAASTLEGSLHLNDWIIGLHVISIVCFFMEKNLRK